MKISLSARRAEFRDFLKSMLATSRERTYTLFDITGAEVIEHLKSYTAQSRPPIRPGGQTRPAHPGGWADVTKQLMEGYGYRVSLTQGGARLEIFNTADHAIYLEARDGYFVVGNIMDFNGPVMLVLRRVLPRVAPGWSLRAF